MFMVFMVAWDWASPVVGLAAVLIFIDSQERPAEMKGIRNSPKAGPQTWGSDQSVWAKKFHCGWSPRLRPRKLKSRSKRFGSSLPARSVVIMSQLAWLSLASSISR